jgi:alcohol dehydrogenase class IV
MRLRLPPTVRFGAGSITHLADSLEECGVRRALVVTDHGVLAAGVVDRVRAEVRADVFVAGRPTAQQVTLCRAALDGCDGVVAVGGGTVIDVAKAAVALHASSGPLAELYGLDRVRGTALPVIAVPTTPGSGGEVSSHAVVTDGDRRHAISGACLVPRAAVIDPDLTASLPFEATVACALDALTHGAEAYLARGATPFSDALALPGVRRIADALPLAGEELSLGCLQANLAMAQANAGLVHALGYPLTSRHGIVHGIANALVAPAVLRASRHVQEDRDADLARCLGAERFADGVAALVERVEVPLGLASRGVVDVDGLAREALRYGPVRANWRFAATVDDIAAMYRESL